MNTYLNEFAKQYNYPEESVEVLLSSYDMLKNDGDFDLLLKSFYSDTNISFEQLSDALGKISEHNFIYFVFT